MEALKKEAANELTTPPNKDSLSGFRGKVKLKAYLDEKGITTKVAANTVKAGGYPKCSSAALSFASNTSMTGVQLVADVYGILYDAHGEPSDLLIRRRSDNRSKPCRLSVRLTESEYRAFNEARGALTAQEFLHQIISEALHDKAE